MDDLIPHTPTANREEIPCPDDWTGRVKDILLNADINEDRMNVKLQQALKEGGHDGLEADEDASKVSERQIRNVFGDCYGEPIEEQRINGLPISLQSRPDFAVWGKRGKMMLSCEGKHKRNFDLGDAVRQSAAYTLVHLYYWLVKRSFLVKNVYGVAVAGTNCRGMDTGKHFTVVLLRLSLPTKIGGQLVLHKHTINHQTGSLKDLWTFSRRVCGIDPERSCDGRLSVGQGCPALLSMPRELPLLYTAGSTWTMIRNGTAALILRVNEPASWKLIKPYMNTKPSDLEVWDEAIKQIEYPFFLKSKNYLSTHNPINPAFYFMATKRENALLVDLKDAYKAEPFLTKCGIYILMADMGIALHGSKGFQELIAPSLAHKLHNFMKKVLGCQETYGIVHGDVHIGNLVYDEAKGVLRLIDYDEANKESITRRTPRTQAQRRVHNEGLLEDAVAYTKNQLINLFWACWGHRDLPTMFNSLRQEYDDSYEEGKRPNADMVNRMYDELCGNLETYYNESKYQPSCNTLFHTPRLSLTLSCNRFACFQTFGMLQSLALPKDFVPRIPSRREQLDLADRSSRWLDNLRV